MPRERTIIGVGEALLCEYPDRIEPGGLAIRCAQLARRMGHTGVPISRLGQDQAANEILTQLKAEGLNINLVQSDPDLPTGRLVVRSIAGQTKRTLSPRAAFDNLQWDYDLVDVAQQADAVIFGMLAQREGQSQSIIRRFLAECRNSVRCFDLSNRSGETVDRAQVRGSLEYVEAMIVDAVALKSLVPGWDGNDPRSAALEILRSSELAFIVTLEHAECRESMVAHTVDASTSASRPYPSPQHDAALVGLIHGVLMGWDMERSVEAARRIAEHAFNHPDEQVPPELLNE